MKFSSVPYLKNFAQRWKLPKLKTALWTWNFGTELSKTLSKTRANHPSLVEKSSNFYSRKMKNRLNLDIGQFSTIFTTKLVLFLRKIPLFGQHTVNIKKIIKKFQWAEKITAFSLSLAPFCLTRCDILKIFGPLMIMVSKLALGGQFFLHPSLLIFWCNEIKYSRLILHWTWGAHCLSRTVELSIFHNYGVYSHQPISKVRS